MNIVNKITSIIQQVNQLSYIDKSRIQEYLEHDEWGIALEELCAAIYEDKIYITKSIFQHIKETAEQMELEPETWEGLRILVLDK